MTPDRQERFTLGVSPGILVHPRIPGVVLLAHDLETLIARLIRIAKTLRKH